MDIDIWLTDPSDVTVEFSMDANIAVITKNSPRDSTASITLRQKGHHIVCGTAPGPSQFDGIDAAYDRGR
jgi:hypothetical protein